MYCNNFVFKVVAKILLLFPLVLCDLMVVWALDDLMLPNNFITIVKGIQSLKKNLKLIQYFKSKIDPCGLLFLKENSKVEQKLKENFQSQIFFSHRKTNSCGALSAYFGT